jgi:nucleotide-binding universal stress UspA family protein
LDAAHQYDVEGLARWLEDIRKEAENNNIHFKIEAIEATSSSTVKAIIDYAEKNTIDLIMLGHKGRSKN